MKKIDLHIHTCSTVSDHPFKFSMTALQMYISTYQLDAIAITNHNAFDAEQFKRIQTTLSIPVFPGIEVDIEHGHLLVITSPSDLDDFIPRCYQVWRYNGSDKNSCITEEQFISTFPEYRKYILIPHYDKSPQLDLTKVPHLREAITCGEVSSVKKFISQKKQSDDLVPILFSDWRACEPLENLDNRQTFIDVEDITLPAIKYALTDREKVSVDSSEGHTTFQVLENGLQISTGLTVVLGKRSSGKSYTLQQIASQFENGKHIEQFALLSKDAQTDQAKFDEALQKKGADISEHFLAPLKAVIDDVRGIDIEQDEKDVDAYLTALKKAANEASRQDIFSKALLYQESLYVIKDLSTLIGLIDAVDLLINNTEYRPIIQRHLDLSSLTDLSMELKAQYIKEESLNSQMDYVNGIVTTIKKELQVRSTATSIPDIAFYTVMMNKCKIACFENVAQLVKHPRIIKRQHLHSYQTIVSSCPYASARELQRVKRSKSAFSGLFDLYNKPYAFLKSMKGRDDIPPSEYYKYFAHIQYCVLNRYGSPASGGERSEFNLLQELNEVSSSDILILDEPESSFDNLFLKDGVDALLKDLSKRIPVVIATHNNTIGLSVHPDYIIYTSKEILDSGEQKFHTYAGNPSSSELIDLEGNRISKRRVLLDCLEAGEDAYMDRRNSYEIFGN